MLHDIFSCKPFRDEGDLFLPSFTLHPIFSGILSTKPLTTHCAQDGDSKAKESRKSQQYTPVFAILLTSVLIAPSCPNLNQPSITKH